MVARGFSLQKKRYKILKSNSTDFTDGRQKVGVETVNDTNNKVFSTKPNSSDFLIKLFLDVTFLDVTNALIKCKIKPGVLGVYVTKI